MVARSFILLFTLVALCCSRDLKQEYRFSSRLDGENYVLYWKFDYQMKNITFAVSVKTTGWVGFGLSPNGQMPLSDVVTGWVDNNGRAMLQDRFADTRATPPIDRVQNWFLIRGDESNGTTTLEFWRNFSSCDMRDREIGKSQTLSIIWSYHPNDPVDPNGNFPVHTQKGNKNLNLLGGLQNERSVPNDSDSFIIRNNQVPIPNNTDFVYWCSYQEHSLPPGDIYIYKAEPMISAGNTKYLQRMVFAVCPTYVDSTFLIDGPCNEIAWLCYYGEYLPGWGSGGGTYTYPEDVAVHINLQAGQRLYVEMHYDNPDRDSGVFDSSGMRFYYTRQRPVHVAGVMTVEFNTFPYLTLVVPPNAEEFNVTATCPSRCHDNTFPDEGITIFSTFHHSNILGKAIIAHRSRTNDQCNAVEELEPIDQNLQFDYTFQEYTTLQEPVTVQKDDLISVTCVYDSKRVNRQGVTLAGTSRRDEQCSVLFNYYPKRHLTFCGTHANAREAYGPFLEKFFPQSVVDTTLAHFDFANPVGVADVFNSIEWTQENITELQRSIERANAIDGYCWFDAFHPDGTAYVEFATNNTNFDCRYEGPNQCTGTQPVSCCDQLRDGLPQQTVVAIAAGASAGLVALIIALVLIVVIVVAVFFGMRARDKGKNNEGERYSELVRKQSVQEDA